ncbi:MAG: hypothetical protein CBB71_08260 [Rhodopirellula sp. TMED11]|nr:MAG: hypothetical protein CBB71_08260 [Rhodopirellula sp. TMED11]
MIIIKNPEGNGVGVLIASTASVAGLQSRADQGDVRQRRPIPTGIGSVSAMLDACAHASNDGVAVVIAV